VCVHIRLNDEAMAGEKRGDLAMQLQSYMECVQVRRDSLPVHIPDTVQGAVIGSYKIWAVPIAAFWNLFSYVPQLCCLYHL
jgi:hypothetical protein